VRQHLNKMDVGSVLVRFCGAWPQASHKPFPAGSWLVGTDGIALAAWQRLVSAPICPDPIEHSPSEILQRQSLRILASIGDPDGWQTWQDRPADEVWSDGQDYIYVEKDHFVHAKYFGLLQPLALELELETRLYRGPNANDPIQWQVRTPLVQQDDPYFAAVLACRADDSLDQKAVKMLRQLQDAPRKA